MVCITNYQKNANQNYNELPPHTDHNNHHQKTYKPMLEKGWRKGSPPTLLVGMSIGTAAMEQHGGSLKKTKYGVTMGPSNPTP